MCFMGRQGQMGAGFQIVRRRPQGPRPDGDTYDVELHKLLVETEIWVDALKPPLRRLVEEAHSVERDGSLSAVTVALQKVHEAIKTLTETAYEREIQ